MKKLHFLKWIQLDKEYVKSHIWANLMTVLSLFIIIWCILDSDFLGASSLFCSELSFKVFLTIFVICFSFLVMLIALIAKYIRIANIVNSTVNDIWRMPEEEITENLNLLIDLMVKNDEDKDHKLKETEHFTKDEARAELYAWIRKIHYA